MSLARMASTHTLQVVRATQVQTDYGTTLTWADHGDPLPARIQDQSAYENVENRDTLVAFKVAIFAGWVDVQADDRLRDGQGQVYDIDGAVTFDQAPGGRLKQTVLRLRAATNL